MKYIIYTKDKRLFLSRKEFEEWLKVKGEGYLADLLACQKSLRAGAFSSGG